MDRAIGLAELAEAEKRVALGERHIVQQERRIAELDRDGHDTREAFALLDTFRQTQVQHVAHRDFILIRLGQAPQVARGSIFRPGQYEGVDILGNRKWP
ncbi:hypothetical protein Q3C01_18495 [Bradyrhizobium sp. UFLA05-109]